MPLLFAFNSIAHSLRRLTSSGDAITLYSMKFDIAFTLGRLQPPHLAHVHMWVDALRMLKDNGKFIQFIGSTNVPLRVGLGEKNVLSFEERRDLVMHALKAQGFALHNVVCIPAPDFSDPEAQFTDDPSASTIACPYEGVRAEAMAHAARINIPDAPIFQVSPCYLGWVLNIIRMLDEAIEAYRQAQGVAHPRVAFIVCEKDPSTQQYIVLLKTLIESHPHAYDFTVVSRAIETCPTTGKPVHATDIRHAFVRIIHDERLLGLLQASPDLLLNAEQYPEYEVLNHLSLYARKVMLTAMLRGK